MQRKVPNQKKKGSEENLADNLTVFLELKLGLKFLLLFWLPALAFIP